MRMSEIIRARRRALGLTQEEAASRLGVTASAFNKWERGVSLPDIGVLPALARLLGVDMNELFNFGSDLSRAEIGEFLNSLDDKARSEGYAATFELGVKKLREYPNCDSLLISTALYLDGALFLYGVEDTESYRDTIDGWYEELCSSTESGVREQAVVMVLSRCRTRGEFERAEALLDSLPPVTVDGVEQRALLYTAQDRRDEARPIWQSRVLDGISEAVTAMAHLVEDAVKSGRTEDAKYITEAIEAVTEAAHLPEWMWLASALDFAETMGEAGHVEALKQRLKKSLDTPWDLSESPLYSMLSGEGVNSLTAKIHELVEREM